MGRSPIIYRLNDPGFTIYHRAALGGLATTIRSWDPARRSVDPPLRFDHDRSARGGVLSDDTGRSVRVLLDAGSVTLEWDEPTTDREALALILQASFRRTDRGMIYLPGHGFGPEREDVLMAAHDAYSRTFLQHAKKRPGQGVESVSIIDEDGKTQLFSYRKVDRYSHQTAQGTSILGAGWDVEPGDIPDKASISQAILPGATVGAEDLAGSPEQVILLHFLMVACPVFSIRSRKWEKKIQTCLVVPDVSNLISFARRIENVGQSPEGLTNSYLGRIAGGAEEAALKFLIDLRGSQTVETLGVSGAQVYGMGRVAWDKNQQYRSWVARVGLPDPDQYPDVAIFEAAIGHLGRAKIIKTKQGEPFAIPASPLPDLIAANLANGGRWSDGFRDLVATKQDFLNLSYQWKGLRAMRAAIQDEIDELIVEIFQEAWEVKRHALSDRAIRDRSDYWSLVDGERERIRNGILRCRSSDMLTRWLLAFAADARRKEPIGALVRGEITVRKFLFNPRNVDRTQNLLLFALVSSRSDDPSGHFKRPPQEK